MYRRVFPGHLLYTCLHPCQSTMPGWPATCSSKHAPPIAVQVLLLLLPVQAQIADTVQAAAHAPACNSSTGCCLLRPKQFLNCPSLSPIDRNVGTPSVSQTTLRFCNSPAQPQPHCTPAPAHTQLMRALTTHPHPTPAAAQFPKAMHSPPQLATAAALLSLPGWGPTWDGGTCKTPQTCTAASCSSRCTQAGPT